MRKKEDLPNALFKTLVLVPSWVGPVMAAVSYLLVRYLAPHLLSGGATDPLAALARGIAPVVPVLVLMVWVAAEYKKWNDRRRLDRTGGLADVHNMSWSEFEALVGEAYRRQGYVVEQTGSAAGDGGIDLVLHRDGQKTLVQCKHWRNRQVGVKVVRELCGAMANADALHGAIVCYGTFTPEARAFAQRNDIVLVDGAALEQMIASVKQNRADLPADGHRARNGPVPTAPNPADSAPLSCPVCGTPMVLRTARKGLQAGRDFWGCPQFPECRGTRPLDGRQ